MWLTRSLGGCEEAGVEGVLKEGVAQAALIHHKESVGEADASEVVGICVDPVRFVSFSPSSFQHTHPHTHLLSHTK